MADKAELIEIGQNSLVLRLFLFPGLSRVAAVWDYKKSSLKVMISLSNHAMLFHLPRDLNFYQFSEAAICTITPAAHQCSFLTLPPAPAPQPAASFLSRDNFPSPSHRFKCPALIQGFLFLFFFLIDCALLASLSCSFHPIILFSPPLIVDLTCVRG